MCAHACTLTRLFPVLKALSLYTAAKDNGLIVWSVSDWEMASGNMPSFTLSILNPLVSTSHHTLSLLLPFPVPPLCSLILWSKLGIYVGASAKEQGGITTSVLVWLLEILRLSVFKPWFKSVEDKYIFCFYRCRGSISIRAKTPIAIIYLSSVKDFHQKHCLHFNAPLAADRLPAAFNGTGKLNEGY